MSKSLSFSALKVNVTIFIIHMFNISDIFGHISKYIMNQFTALFFVVGIILIYFKCELRSESKAQRVIDRILAIRKTIMWFRKMYTLSNKNIMTVDENNWSSSDRVLVQVLENKDYVIHLYLMFVCLSKSPRKTPIAQRVELKRA